MDIMVKRSTLQKLSFSCAQELSARADARGCGGIALLGIAIDCGLDWVPLLLALSGPLLHYGIILREGAI